MFHGATVLAKGCTAARSVMFARLFDTERACCGQLPRAALERQSHHPLRRRLREDADAV